jgi:hypothetical protein
MKHFWKDLLYALGKGLYKTEDEEVAEQKFLEFLKKWENEEFLKELRKDWKETLKKLLKGEREDLLATFVRKDQQEGKLTYGTFFAPSKKIKLYIFYEKGLEGKLKDFEEGFKNALRLAKNFVGNAEIELAKEPRPIEEIIPNLEKLKKLDLDNLKHEDSLDLLFSLIYFACRIKNLKAIVEKEKSLVGALLLLNVKKEDFKLDGEHFYHSALQVFSTKGPGWEREEVYSEKKNLFLFSVLSLSLYESESFRTPYSKLDLWQKKRTVYLSIRRKNWEYKMPLNTVLYEMLYLLGKVSDDL